MILGGFIYRKEKTTTGYNISTTNKLPNAVFSY